MPSTSATARAGRAAAYALAVAAVATAATLYVDRGSFALARLASDEFAIHSDLDTFRRSARALLDGTDPYATGARDPNLNPPLFVVLCVPLALLAPPEAYRLTVLLGAVLLAGSLAAVAAACRPEARLAVPATVALLVSSPVLGTLGLGQVYPLLTAGLVAAWLAARAARPVAEGAALGLVVALKPSLAPVLLVPALQGRLPATAAGALTAVVATAAGALVTGPAALATWAGSLLARPAQTYGDNASLPATLARLTFDSGSGSPVAVVPGGFAAGLVLGLLAVGIALWRVHRDGDAGGTGLWAVAAAALLASPVSWHNYLTLLMPGVLVLLARRETALAAPLLALPLIGMEWPGLWYGSGVPASAVPVSLYCAILVLYAVALLPRRD